MIKNNIFRQLAFLMLFLNAGFAFGQSGVIEGRVIDKETQEPLFGASIILEGTTVGAMVDMDGHYVIANVRPGNYNLSGSYISYETQTVENIEIKPGETIRINLELESQYNTLEAVGIVARANRETETALLLDRRNAIVSTQSIGALELSRKGIGDAQSAVSSVSGISKQDGVKNIFVRGLGDRYNSTLLNGLPLPSEDPEYKNIALSFFQTDVIQNIGVNKVFSAQNTADVGGAIIDITSKELFDSYALGLDVSGGFNTNVVDVDFLRADGSGPFGLTNKDRPSLNQFNFPNKLDPAVAKMPINQSFKLSGGKRLRINGNPLSFFLVASHSSEHSYSEEIVRNMNTAGVIYQNQKGKKYSQNINQLLLGNLNYSFGNRNSIAYNFMLLHATHQYVGEFRGRHSERHQDGIDDMGYLRRQQINDNTLMTHQLLTKWTLTNRLNMRINGSFNSIKAYEPDRRENYLSMKADGTYGLTGSNRQKRFFSDLMEDNYNAQLVFDYQLNDAINSERSKISVGYNTLISDNEFNAVEYNFSAIPGSFSPNNILLDEIYNSQNYNQNLFSMTEGSPNSYSVSKNVQSAFAEVTYQFSDAFSANAGMRFDQVDMDVEYDIPGRADNSNELKQSFYLPSLNLRYDLDDQHILRLGASKTYTLPQSKEISPYQYVNIGFASEGNPNLKPSDNYNVDIKWDNYLSPTELLSATAFFKHIENPIGRVDQGNSAGLLTYNNIGESATVLGIEVELRKEILNNENTSGSQSSKLSFGLNTSWIYTDVTLDITNTPKRNSELEGASPFLLNSDLTYQFTDSKNRSLTSSIVFHYFSDRIYTIGALGYEDIMEEGVPTLDFVSSYQVSKTVGLKFKAANLLDPSFILTRNSNHLTGKTILNEYKKGINLSLGVRITL